jgi:DNA primase
MINLPEELKSRISIEDVISRYWEEPGRAHRVKCFAHNGKDRNMLVKNGFVYCFVCGARFDIIGAVQHLFGLSFIQACEKLNSDFNCGLPIGKKLTRSEIEKLKRAKSQRIAARQVAEERKRLEKRIFRKVRDELHLTQAIVRALEPSKPIDIHALDEKFIDVYFSQLKRLKWLEWLADTLLGYYTDCEWTYTIGMNTRVIYDRLISGDLKI